MGLGSLVSLGPACLADGDLLQPALQPLVPQVKLT